MKMLIFISLVSIIFGQTDQKKFIQSIVDTLIFENSKYSKFKFSTDYPLEAIEGFKSIYKRDKIPADIKKAYSKGITDAILNIEDSILYYCPKYNVLDSLDNNSALINGHIIVHWKSEINSYESYILHLQSEYNVQLKFAPFSIFPNDPAEAYYYTFSLISNKYLEYLHGKKFIERVKLESKVIFDKKNNIDN